MSLETSPVIMGAKVINGAINTSPTLTRRELIGGFIAGAIAAAIPTLKSEAAPGHSATATNKNESSPKCWEVFNTRKQYYNTTKSLEARRHEHNDPIEYSPADTITLSCSPDNI